MDEKTHVARSLAALGHEARLDIFRLLVKAGHTGMTVGQIGAHLDMAASTLAHHLRTLVDAALVVQSKSGREVVNTVSFDEMSHVVHFLTDQCCSGIPMDDTESAA